MPRPWHTHQLDFPLSRLPHTPTPLCFFNYRVTGEVVSEDMRSFKCQEKGYSITLVGGSLFAMLLSWLRIRIQILLPLRWCGSVTICPQTLQDSILRLQASFVSFPVPPRLHFESLNYLNVVTDPDPAFHSNADPDPACKNNADPDPQPSLHYHEGMQFLFVEKGKSYALAQLLANGGQR